MEEIQFKDTKTPLIVFRISFMIFTTSQLNRLRDSSSSIAQNSSNLSKTTVTTLSKESSLISLKNPGLTSTTSFRNSKTLLVS
jgi:hypothetical protein